MTDSPVLVATGLGKRFGALEAVKCFDADVPAGTVLGFLGPNGAGKTTVIRMISTILQPDAGTFEVAGIPAARPTEIRLRIGVLPESAGYPQGQTGEEWLTYHARLFGQSRSSARSTAHRLLAEVGLDDRGGSLISAYSRGMRQRLGVARALVNDPALVVLDEPTLGLDPSGQVQLLDLISRLARDHGVTVIVSTHLLDEVEQVCDRVVILHRGRVVAEGTVAEVVLRAAAPRRALLRVSPDRLPDAVRALEAGSLQVSALGGHRDGHLELTAAAGEQPEAVSARAVGALVAAGIPLLGLGFEGGRLSDAFLAVTEAE
jgi:ABC-2 type transport system ATP-binding protein